MSRKLDETVLEAVRRLGDNAYGVTIHQELIALTGRDVSYGALYEALGRLRRHGLITLSHGEATAERGWRPKLMVREV